MGEYIEDDGSIHIYSKEIGIMFTCFREGTVNNYLHYASVDIFVYFQLAPRKYEHMLRCTMLLTIHRQK